MNIASNEVHLWCAYDEEIQDTEVLTLYRRLLNKEERAQQKRFFFKKHQHQYLITRALARVVLSLYVDTIRPDAWEFGKNEYNKPYIRNFPLQVPLNFNISHTEGMVVLAVTLDKEIGVDVEYLHRGSTGLEIAERYFSKIELEALKVLSVPQQRDRFFDLWTLKEAYIKACGMGLSIPLDQFSYSFPEIGDIQISFDAVRDDDPNYWKFWQLKPNDKHAMALALKNFCMHERYSLSIREITPLLSMQQVHYPIVAQSQLHGWD